MLSNLTIYVTSANPAKIQAVSDAFNSDCVVGVTTASGVPEQPIGDEGPQGCRNRLENLKMYMSSNQLEADIYVSIENWVEIDRNNSKKVHDICDILIYRTDTSQTYSSTGGWVEFPFKYYTHSLLSGQTLTCGELIEKDRGYKKGAWHEHFENKQTRIEIIKTLIQYTIKREKIQL